MKIAPTLLFLFSVTFCLATCESNQININTASLSDLDKLTGIGPAYAQAIVTGRVYSSLDDLLKIKGIGPKTLEKIKVQNLACVDSKESYSKNTSPIKEEVVEDEEENLGDTNLETTASAIKNTETLEEAPRASPEEEPSESIINLNSNTNPVKEKVIYESRNEKIRKYAIFAFAVFLLLIITFLLLEKNGRTKDYRSDDY